MVKKIIAYILGGTCAFAIAMGMIMLFSSETVTLSAAITVICLSLASGLLAPNPISLVGLAAGICMIVLPAEMVGVLFVCIGIAGGIVNFFVWKKKMIVCNNI